MVFSFSIVSGDASSNGNDDFAPPVEPCETFTSTSINGGDGSIPINTEQFFGIARTDGYFELIEGPSNPSPSTIETQHTNDIPAGLGGGTILAECVGYTFSVSGYYEIEYKPLDNNGPYFPPGSFIFGFTVEGCPVAPSLSTNDIEGSCTSRSINPTGPTDGSTWYWQIGSSVETVPSDDDSFQFTGARSVTSSGYYALQAKKNGCWGPKSSVIYVTAGSDPGGSIGWGPDGICAGDPINIVVNGGSSSSTAYRLLLDGIELYDEGTWDAAKSQIEFPSSSGRGVFTVQKNTGDCGYVDFLPAGTGSKNIQNSSVTSVTAQLTVSGQNIEYLNSPDLPIFVNCSQNGISLQFTKSGWTGNWSWYHNDVLVSAYDDLGLYPATQVATDIVNGTPGEIHTYEVRIDNYVIDGTCPSSLTVQNPTEIKVVRQDIEKPADPDPSYFNECESPKLVTVVPNETNIRWYNSSGSSQLENSLGSTYDFYSLSEGTYTYAAKSVGPYGCESTDHATVNISVSKSVLETTEITRCILNVPAEDFIVIFNATDNCSYEVKLNNQPISSTFTPPNTPGSTTTSPPYPSLKVNGLATGTYQVFEDGSWLGDLVVDNELTDDPVAAITGFNNYISNDGGQTWHECGSENAEPLSVNMDGFTGDWDWYKYEEIGMIWEKLDGYQNSTFTPEVSGRYKVKFSYTTVTGNCTNALAPTETDEKTIKLVDTDDVPAQSPQYFSYCEPDKTIFIPAQPSEDGITWNTVWYDQNGITKLFTGDTYDASSLLEGTTTLKVRYEAESYGCPSEVFTNVQITINPPAGSLFTTELTHCQTLGVENNIQISSTDSDCNYTFESGAFSVTPTIQIDGQTGENYLFTDTPLPYGTIEVKANGYLIGTVEVIEPVMAIDKTSPVSNDPVCPGTQINFTATEGSGHIWSDGIGTTLENPVSFFPEATTEYTVEATVCGLQKSESITIEVIDIVTDVQITSGPSSVTTGLFGVENSYTAVSEFEDEILWEIDPPEAGTIDDSGNALWKPLYEGPDPVVVVTAFGECSSYAMDEMTVSYTDLLACDVSTLNATSSMNHVVEHTAKVPLEYCLNNIDDSSQVMKAVSYFDGLGRPIQTVQVSGSPQGYDLVSALTYDDFGRQEKSYLPFPANESSTLDVGSYRSDWEIQQVAAIDARYGTTEKDYGFSQQLYEASPLGRPLKVGAPGSTWNVNGTHAIEYEYTVFDASIDIKKINVVNDIIVLGDDYSQGQLLVTLVKDENEGAQEGQTYEYKNSLGQVIMKQTRLTVTEFAKTYYVYDEFGNLRYVVQPQGVEEILDDDDNWAKLNETDFRFNWMFCYEYDHRNRIVKKRVPGAGWTEMVYDNRDRIVLTQDENQRNNFELIETDETKNAYEGVNYVITEGNSLTLEPGFEFSASSSKNFSVKFGDAGDIQEDWTFTKYDVHNRPVMTGIMMADSDLDIQSDLNTYYVNNPTSYFETYIGTDAPLKGYSNNSYPNVVTESDLLDVAYYDTYDEMGYFGDPAIEEAKGFITGGYVRVLGTEDWLSEGIWYDENYRTLAALHTSHIGEDVANAEFYFHLNEISPLVETEYAFHITNGETFPLAYHYTYDHMDRIDTLSHEVENVMEIDIADHDYNEFGELVTKTIGGGIQQIDYDYNIRGWLTSVNGGQTSGGDVFGYSLEYDNAPNLQFNGNIGAMSWQRNGPQGNNNPQSFDYTYDAASRILSADYTSSGINDHFNMNVWEYDHNGNIRQLSRRHTSTSPSDSLTYSYTGNRLTSVLDDGDIQLFEDSNTQSDDYSYDSNGNMTSDLNKTINDISYNYLNLPVKVTFDDGTLVEYTYDAVGTKLSKKITSGQGIKVEHYVGGWHYVQDYGETEPIPEFFQFPGGRINIETGYNFDLTDHLGNVRVTIDQTGTVLQTDDYYPFGLTFNSYTSGTENLYKYNGKEEQKETGNYDYGARMYDPALGRFWQIDPSADNYLEWTPYNYVGNNPINVIDPDGKDWYDINGKIRWRNQEGDYTNKKGETFSSLGKNVLVVTHNRDKKGNEKVNSATFSFYLESNKSGATATLKGNTVPSDTEKYGTLAEGTYTARFQARDSKPGENALIINEGGELPTVNGNPNKENSDKLTGVFFHRGNPYQESLKDSNGNPVWSHGCLLGGCGPGSLDKFNEFMSNAQDFNGNLYLRAQPVQVKTRATTKTHEWTRIDGKLTLVPKTK